MHPKVLGTKKQLTIHQIISLNIGLLGVQFAWSLAVANMSGIYGLFGANVSSLGYLWLAPSIVALLIPPFIGYLSDRTHTVFGKRIPYIFVGSVLTAICMLILPNVHSLFMAAILLCIFSATINIALQPYRPLVADVVPASSHTKLYAIQAGLIGIGAALASAAPWVFLHLFHVRNIVVGVPLEIRFAFYGGAIALIITGFWTLVVCKSMLPAHEKITTPKIEGSFLNIVKQKAISMLTIPRIMRQVSYVQFFTWLGVFGFIVYLTPAIEQAIFHVSPTAHLLHNASYHKLVEKSTILTGIACAVYMLANVAFAYCIPLLSKLISRKTIHIIALLFGAASLISLRYVHQESWLLFAMIGFGIAWASFNSIPFAMIAAELPTNKLGYYMGIFNVAICLPQIIVSVFAGFLLLRFLHGSATNLILLSGFCFIIAALLMLPIKDHN